MRILLSIHHDLDEGFGAPGATLRLGRAYADLGHEVSYLSFDDLPPALPRLAKEGLYPEIAAWRLWRATREAPIDVIDASTGDAWLWGHLRRGGRPLLVTRSHGLEHRFWAQTVAEAARAETALPWHTALYHGRVRLWEVAASLRAADLALLLNGADRDLAIGELGVASERAHVVANGLPPSMLGRPLTTLAEPPSIAHIGSWAERKGTRYLAPALANVLLAHPTTRLSLLGTRLAAAEVRAAFPGEVRHRIAVLPEYEPSDLPELIEGHRIAVSASLAEGFSLALPEAMACGLVPVATGIPGTIDLISDDADGLLVPPRDPAAMTQAITRLLADEALVERLRAGAHARVQELSWPRIAGETIELCQRALAR